MGAPLRIILFFLLFTVLFNYIYAHPYGINSNDVSDVNQESDTLLWNRLITVLPIEKTIATHKKLKSTSIPTWLSCAACNVGAKAIQFYIHMGASKQSVANLATSICKKLEVTTPRACEGISREFQDEVVYVFSQVSLKPAAICGSILDEDCGSNNPSNMWNVTFPDVPKPPVVPMVNPTSSSPVLKVLHLSDVHLDPDYVVGGAAACNEPLCCHEATSNAKVRSGSWGDYRKCDTPLQTLISALKQISATQKIDYIIWTGDDTPHNIWNQTKQNSIDILQTVGTYILKYFPGVPVFPSLGNHEGIPVNSFPVHDGKSSSPMSWLYEALSESWARWLPKETAATINKGGYYTAPVFPGFRIISLNMNFCNNLNWWLLLDSKDPMGELQWLIGELQKAEDNKEKVHIIGHIPPGSSDCLQAWSYNYYKIVTRYESTIRGQFFGHTHVDEFQQFYDLSNANRRPVSTAFVGPSLTTYVNLNPSYRIYTMDGNYQNSSWTVLDHSTYFFNLTEANLYGKPKWRLLYNAKETYNMSSLQPDQMDNLILRLSKSDSLFQTYYRHFGHASDVYPAMDKTTKKSLICRMQMGRSFDQSLCLIH
ncbi:hypothetical protein CHUAL_001924 [Chamberlinius hualienensis]